MYGVGDTKRAVAKPREGLFIEVVVIGFVGAILFLVVDKFERSPMANLLKFLILVVGGVAILHKLHPLLGITLF
jgi:hypothetical protein